MADFKVTVKRNIAPVTVLIELTFSRVNENGTFSGASGKVVKQPLKGNDIQLSFPPRGGGAMYAMCWVCLVCGVLGASEGTTEVAEKTKLF